MHDEMHFGRILHNDNGLLSHYRIPLITILRVITRFDLLKMVRVHTSRISMLQEMSGSMQSVLRPSIFHFCLSMVLLSSLMVFHRRLSDSTVIDLRIQDCLLLCRNILSKRCELFVISILVLVWQSLIQR